MGAALWLSNLNNAGSESGAGPVGPGAGREMMLLWIGRCIVGGIGLEMLREGLWLVGG